MIVSHLVSHGDPCAPALRGEAAPSLSYGALRDLIAATGARLHARGIEAGSVVALALPNGPAAASAFLGVASAATAAPLNPHFTEAECEFSLRDLGARLVVCTRDLDRVAVVAARLGLDVLYVQTVPGDPAGAFRLEEDSASRAGGRLASPRLPRPQDYALLLHTSGTTSRPKLVGLTHANLRASARQIAASLALSAGDCCLNVMPLFHIHGIAGALLASLHAGGQVYCAPGFNGHRFFGWLTASGATWYTAVPTIHQAVLARAGVNGAALAAHRLRFVRSCSAPLPVQVWDALERVFGVPVVSAYGMTEASHQISCTSVHGRSVPRGSVGIPAGVEVGIMDAGGSLLPPGEKGEVVLRGESVIAAYLGSPDANAMAFCSGWFRTGDEGVLDRQNVLTLTGRLKELINTGGEKVSPLEVDQALMEHPGVAQAVAFAVGDALLGERVAAAVVLRPGHDVSPEALRAFAGERLVKHKVPGPLVIVPSIPAGPTGKFQRSLLANQLGLV